MSENSTDWRLFGKLMLILTFIVGLGITAYVALRSSGVWISQCSDGGYFWIFVPFCRGEASPHEPSIAYVLALAVVLAVWMGKKMRSLMTRQDKVAARSDES
jgi:hypothetical protein